jgi:hypothetical protein
MMVGTLPSGSDDEKALFFFLSFLAVALLCGYRYLSLLREGNL